MKPRSVTVEIEELVLHGCAPGDRHRVAAAVTRELERLLRQQGLPAPLAEPAHFTQREGGTIPAESGVRPESLGREVARAVYRASGGSSQRRQPT